jgi:hypothetical protein
MHNIINGVIIISLMCNIGLLHANIQFLFINRDVFWVQTRGYGYI